MAERSSSIVAIGAHPDDIEFGCGGTIALHANRGDLITFIYITNGERGGNPNERVKEAKEAAKILGVQKVEFFGFPDGAINDSIDIVNRIEEVLKAVDADLVFSHTPSERHQDHRNVALATTSAARDCPALLYYETPSSSSLFRPQYYVNITDTIEKKLEAVKRHMTQQSKRTVKPESVEGQARFRGFDPQFQFAECFEISHLHGIIQAPHHKSNRR